MSEILVNTIKKADGTGSLTVPAETGTVLTSGGAIDVNASAPDDSVAINASGNVGIGTTSPGAKLHTSVSSGGNKIIVQNTAASQQSVLQLNTDSTTPGQCQIYMGKTSAPTNGQVGYNPGSDYLYFYSNNVERMAINGSGKVLINTTATTSNEQVRIKTGDDTRAISFQSATSAEAGYIYINAGGTSVSYSTSSDYRLKENVVDMTDAIDRVKALKPSRFNFIADPDTTVDGFLAHEAQEIVPEAVTGTKDAMRTEEYEVTPAVLDDDGNVVTEAVMGEREVPVMQGIDQSKLVPLLTGALQEAIAKIETLETTVADLQTRVTALEGA